MPAKGGARPHAPPKNNRNVTRRNRSKNKATNSEFYKREAAALKIELLEDHLRRAANRANSTLKKIREGKVSKSAMNQIERNAKRNANLVSMFSGLGK